MENKQSNDSGKYWPYMILGFLFIGITLGYWTVKHAIGLPVQESNEYMMKYQKADKNADKLVEQQLKFNKNYNVKLQGLEKSDFKPEYLKRKPKQVMALKKSNSIAYVVTDKDGKVVSDANVSLLLTRPHTREDDKMYPELKFKEGAYRLDNLVVNKPGRYILRVRVSIGDDVGFQDTPAYRKPSK